jgi:two-component system NtrC family response regulator
MKNKLRILLVDDVQDILDVIGMLLEMDGHELRYAMNYNDALALVESEPFDLVISDYRMPRMHGIYLLEMIKDVKPDLPVIIMTAYGTDDMLAEAKRKGVDMVLTKPFSYNELADGIRKLNRKWRK